MWFLDCNNQKKIKHAKGHPYSRIPAMLVSFLTSPVKWLMSWELVCWINITGWIPIQALKFYQRVNCQQPLV